MKNQKGFSTVKNIGIIIFVVIILLGGILAYHYFSGKSMKQYSENNATTNTPATNSNLPTVNITANNSMGNITVQKGDTVKVTWTSENADNCTANSNPIDPNLSGSWSAHLTSSGSLPTLSPTKTIIYTVTCFNANGNGSNSITINVSPK